MKVWKPQTRIDFVSQKDDCFQELMEECRHAPPGSKLSYSLRHRLSKFSPDTRREIVNRTKSGCAPLFLACKRGQLEMVEYLVLECQADIEQRGCYEILDDRYTLSLM